MRDQRAQIVEWVRHESEGRKLDPHVICAVIEMESSFDPFAMRYEPFSMRTFAVEECAKLHGITEVTERMAQKFSFGLGQVLGSTVRWLGFRDLLTCLCDAQTGIFWCCEAFQRLGAKYDKLEDKLAAYNAGSVQRKADGTYINQKYVDTVLKYIKEEKYYG